MQIRTATCAITCQATAEHRGTRWWTRTWSLLVTNSCISRKAWFMSRMFMMTLYSNAWHCTYLTMKKEHKRIDKKRNKKGEVFACLSRLEEFAGYTTSRSALCTGEKTRPLVRMSHLTD